MEKAVQAEQERRAVSQADGDVHLDDQPRRIPGTDVFVVSKKTVLPGEAAARKGIPITTGVFDYFPRALAYIAMISKAGNDQHNPGQPLHWDRTKSMDHADCIGRHLIERGTRDLLDGLRHSGKMGWRSLANLELELEAAEKAGQAW